MAQGLPIYRKINQSTKITGIGTPTNHNNTPLPMPKSSHQAPQTGPPGAKRDRSAICSRRFAARDAVLVPNGNAIIVAQVAAVRNKTSKQRFCGLS